ncbi:acyltransferase family protein [Ochrobactrum sp. A-1]|uniref:acyltransferase family protein n=1 Tax=Ochrobactrum sp. A-1 TaxID=2920940 RepID=UPI001F0A9727|nr:acyltransferase [Ochrobactrum sp. A-1]
MAGEKNLTSGGRIDFPNTLRGVAALSVMIDHYAGFYIGDRGFLSEMIHAPILSTQEVPVPAYLELPSILPTIIYGSFGVALFFIISGFVIPLSLARETRLTFAISRIFRIYPTYIAGFGITVASIYLSTRYFGLAWPFGWGIAPHFIPGLREVFRVPNIDWIIWTLETEIKFYVVCVLLLPWLRKSSLWVFAFPICLAVFGFLLSLKLAEWKDTAYITYHLAYEVIMGAPYLVYMFIGVVFNFLYRKVLSVPVGLVIISAIFICFVYGIRLGPKPEFAIVSWSYAYAIPLFGFAMLFPRVFRSNAVGDFFASISYPLYVVHGITGYVALRILSDLGAEPWLALLIVTPSIFALAWLLHKFVETPTRLFGKRVAAQLEVAFPSRRTAG